MSVNHHLLAKTTTDSVLANFKSGNWTCLNNMGADFYRVGCDSTFPSPDATFYDDVRKMMVAFEFKPPTETKRGILTGLGQTIAYLKNSNIAYLIVPDRLDDFLIGNYMRDLFEEQIGEKLPIGLITYDNNSPSNVSLIRNVNSIEKVREFKATPSGRFWAKHLDMPIPLFHLILHCYYLKMIGRIDGDAFVYCWNNYLVPESVLDTLSPITVNDINGNPIKTLSGRKNITFFEKKINTYRKIISPEEKIIAQQKLIKDRDTSFIGDNYYNSIRKNFVTFLKHIGVIDSVGNITDDGFKLYHLGLVNGPHSMLFRDYFTQRVLMTGNHLDLIFDLDVLSNKYRCAKNMMEIRQLLEVEYEDKGMIKRNPNRKAADISKVEFLKYEFILWNSLGLFADTEGIPEKSFNWKKITEICSLPEI